MRTLVGYFCLFTSLLLGIIGHKLGHAAAWCLDHSDLPCAACEDK